MQLRISGRDGRGHMTSSNGWRRRDVFLEIVLKKTLTSVLDDKHLPHEAAGSPQFLTVGLAASGFTRISSHVLQTLPRKHLRIATGIEIMKFQFYSVKNWNGSATPEGSGCKHRANRTVALQFQLQQSLSSAAPAGHRRKSRCCTHRRPPEAVSLFFSVFSTFISDCCS